MDTLNLQVFARKTEILFVLPKANLDHLNDHGFMTTLLVFHRKINQYMYKETVKLIQMKVFFLFFVFFIQLNVPFKIISAHMRRANQ